jgi:two-component system, sensor histidine kinase LadS
MFLTLPFRLVLVCLLSASLWFGQALAQTRQATSLQTPLQTPLPADGSFSARGHVTYLVDTSGRRTLRDVFRLPAVFSPVLLDIPQFDARHRPHWLRARVMNTTTHAEPFVAEIAYPFLESVQFFLLTDTGDVLTQSAPMSWASPLRNRPMAHQNPLFRFTLNPRQSAWLYLRAIGGKMRLTVPLRLHTSDDFVVADRSQRLFWDSVSGMMWFIMLFSLFLSGILRNRIYAIYGLYVLASWLYLIGNEGYLLTWSNRSHYGPVSAIDFPIVCLYVAILVSFWLIRVYILPPVIHHRWLRWLYRTAMLGPLLASILVLTNAAETTLPGWPGAVIRVLEPICYMVSMLMMLGVLIYLTLRRTGSPDSAAAGPARLYLLAISPPVLQVILGFLRERNLVPDLFISREGAALTSLLEFIILIGALSYQYKRIADERQSLAVETARQRQQLLESQLNTQREELRAVQAQLRLKDEKERIARDLHDHVGAQLSVIAANANGAMTTAAAAVQLGDYAREAMQSLRDTVWAIDQSELTMGNFRAKIQQYLNRQQQLHPACTYTLTADTQPDRLLSSAQALNLFRQVQEAVHNAFKHAQASQVTVSYQAIANQLTISIADNGLGFDTTRLPTDQPHYGLRNLHRRADELQGTCQIDTAPGGGTQVVVTIPLTV